MTSQLSFSGERDNLTNGNIHVMQFNFFLFAFESNSPVCSRVPPNRVEPSATLLTVVSMCVYFQWCQLMSVSCSLAITKSAAPCSDRVSHAFRMMYQCGWFDDGIKSNNAHTLFTIHATNLSPRSLAGEQRRVASFPASH